MCTSTFIRRHVLSLPQGAIFSTREMLNYGRRSAVDQCLYRMVKTGRIIRLAWGLFMKDDIGATTASSFTVATEKARAFGKQIMIDAIDAAKLLGLSPVRNKSITYAVEGHSSSFKYGKITIHLKGICARKMSLGDGSIGLAIKALWQLGMGACDLNALASATANFRRPERLQFRQSCHLMPAWMTNLFKS